VPGINSGLSPSDPTLVAAFRSALLHQGAIALILVVFLWLIWALGGTLATARAQSVAAAARQWSQLTTLPALAASVLGRNCGLVAVNAVSLGQNKTRWRREAAYGGVWPGFSLIPAVRGVRPGWGCPRSLAVIGCRCPGSSG
jgi:hypothetical protein